MNEQGSELIDLIREQSGISRDVLRAQQDINTIGQLHREDTKNLTTKIDKNLEDNELAIKELKLDIDTVKTDLKIYKAMSGFLALIIAGLAWLIDHIEVFKGILQ